MKPTSLGRFVFIVQWIAPILLPIWIIFGRIVIGSPMGWMMVIGVMYGLFLIVALYIPAVLTLFDRDVRRTGSTRRGYRISALVTWAALLLVGVTLPDGGDSGEVGSALTVWTGGAVDQDVTSILTVALFAIAVIGLVAMVVAAVVGIVSARAAQDAPVAARTNT